MRTTTLLLLLVLFFISTAAFGYQLGLRGGSDARFNCTGTGGPTTGSLAGVASHWTVAN